MKTPERGVALITVLLMMGLALLLVAGLLRGHRLLVQSTAQQLHELQMRQWAFSAEGLAQQVLARDQSDLWARVHLGQPWAQSGLQLESAGGDVQIAIEDLGGRLNLGALLVPGRPDGEMERRWTRLLVQQQLPPVMTTDMVAAELLDLSRLRLIPGLAGRHIRQLEPLVVLLPSTALLNINTASAPVLASLGIPLSVAQQLVARRPGEGYASVQDFLQDPLLTRLNLSAHGLVLHSDWFRVTVRVTLGSRQLRWVSDLTLDTDRRRLRVVRRRLLSPLDNVL
jgi:general secretion pathway protein K